MRSIIKRTGLSPVEDMRREMDRIFDEMAPFSWWQDEGEDGLTLWAPNTDMTETENEYVINVDLPGIPKEDVNISFQDNRLVISGERRKEGKEEKENFLRRERYFGSFIRTFTLPNAVKDDGIKAKYHEGVLTVTVPKSEKSKAKNVQID